MNPHVNRVIYVVAGEAPVMLAIAHFQGANAHGRAHIAQDPLPVKVRPDTAATDC
jgi:hypothetical protein